MATPNELEALKSDFEALKERINLAYAKAASKVMTIQDMAALSIQIREMQAQLDELRGILEAAKS